MSEIRPDIKLPPWRPTRSEHRATRLEYALCVAACAEFYELKELLSRAKNPNTVPKSRVRNMGGAMIKALGTVKSPLGLAERHALREDHKILGGGSEALVLRAPDKPSSVKKIFGASLNMIYGLQHDFAARVQAGHDLVRGAFGDQVVPIVVRVENTLPFQHGTLVSGVVGEQPYVEPEVDLLRDLITNRDPRPLIDLAHTDSNLSADVVVFANTFSDLVDEGNFAATPDVLGRWNVVGERTDTGLKLRILDAQTSLDSTSNNILTPEKLQRTTDLAEDLLLVATQL